MSPKRRSSVLLLLLPGLIGGTVYIYAGKRPIEREAVAAVDEIARTRTQLPTPAQETRQASREKDLLEELKALEAALATHSLSPSAAGSGERLSLLLARHRLLLIEETLDPGSSAGALPPGMDKTGAGRLRQLRIAGRYLDVLAALRGLLDPSIGAIPLRLVMAREGVDVRWTLLLWM